MSPKPSTVSRMRNAARSIIGSPRCPSSRSRIGGHAAVLLVELPGVPHHRRFASVRVDRVAVDPAEAELEERVGPHLGGAVAGHVDVEADVSRARAGVAARVMPAWAYGSGSSWWMRARMPMYSSITATRCVVGGGVEVVLAGHDVDHERARLVDPAVHVGDRDAVGLEQLLEPHLVLEREQRRGVGAVAAHHQGRRGSPSRSTSTNQTGRQRACCRMPVTSGAETRTGTIR